jgi:hypothetical protein
VTENEKLREKEAGRRIVQVHPPAKDASAARRGILKEAKKTARRMPGLSGYVGVRTGGRVSVCLCALLADITMQGLSLHA